ncbi:MAG: hypothetical protein RL681_374 [Candidatus Parcubacteria bacterium]|jgi:hypothetical protein
MTKKFVSSALYAIIASAVLVGGSSFIRVSSWTNPERIPDGISGRGDFGLPLPYVHRWYGGLTGDGGTNVDYSMLGIDVLIVSVVMILVIGLFQGAFKHRAHI